MEQKHTRRVGYEVTRVCVTACKADSLRGVLHAGMVSNGENPKHFVFPGCFANRRAIPQTG